MYSIAIQSLSNSTYQIFKTCDICRGHSIPEDLVAKRLSGYTTSKNLSN